MPRPDSEPSVRTAGDLLPIMDPLFNVREACKQSALLEDHLNQPRKRCPDCIRKHFLTLEALFEEAVSLSSDDPPWAGWAERVRGWAGEWAAGRDPFEVAQELRKMRKELTPMCFETGLREASAAQRLARLHLARRHVCANPLEPLARLESWLNARRRELEDSEENYWDVAHDRVEALAELLEEVNDYLVDGTPRGAPPPWDRYAEEIMELDDVVVYLNDGSGSRYVASISAPLPLRPARLAPSASALWNEAL